MPPVTAPSLHTSSTVTLSGLDPAPKIPTNPEIQNKEFPWITSVPHDNPTLKRFRDYMLETSLETLPIRDEQNFANSAVSANGCFIVFSNNADVAQEIADQAVHTYGNLSMEWFGARTASPQEPFIICAVVGSSLGAGGATGMQYENKNIQFRGCYMQGTRERVLDSVLPHELTHTVSAQRFNHYMPRWADEGSASMLEHPSESRKMQRGIESEFAQRKLTHASILLTQTEYPTDKNQILPFYYQGYSLTRFLVARGEEIEKIEGDGVFLTGKQRFGKFLGEAVTANYSLPKLEQSLKTLYGFNSVYEFDRSWKLWLENQSDQNKSLQTVRLSSGPEKTIQYNPNQGETVTPSASRSNGALPLLPPVVRNP